MEKILETDESTNKKQKTKEQQKSSEAKPAKKRRDSKAKEIKALLTKQAKEIEDLKAENLRRRAEFENFRKRVEKEKQDFAKYALEKNFGDLLPIMDSFSIAINNHKKDNKDQELFDGFELIFKQLIDFANKHGLCEIEALGKEFDPNLHQAVGREAVDDSSNMVIKEYQKGYKLHNRVIRPSMVIVSE